jgi:3-oxoacyl-[acyl-carrier protein] reductase
LSDYKNCQIIGAFQKTKITAHAAIPLQPSSPFIVTKHISLGHMKCMSTHVYILVNNAADYNNRGWAESTPDGWAELYNLNVLSCVRMIRFIMPQMKKNEWGRIIQISSGEATQPFAFMPDYAATKAALNNLTVSLSKELANTGITSNTISPGIIATVSLEKFYRQTAAK